MADNITGLNASGQAVVFTSDNWTADPNGSSQMLPAKIVWGARDTLYNWTSMASGLPVQPSTGAIWQVSLSPGIIAVSGSVTVGNFPASQTIAGTVTANQGASGSAAWPVSATQNGSWTVTASAGAGTFTTSDTHFPAVTGLGDGLANPTATQIGANLLGWDATNSVWRRIQVDAGTGVQKVDASAYTQPVCGSITATQGSPPWTQNVTQFGGSNAVTGSGVGGAGIPRVTVSSDSTVTANQGTANATPWNANVAQVGAVTVAATGKGIQGTNFIPVQQPKDTGRNNVVFVLDRIAGVTTEAMATLSINKGGTVTSSGSYTVAAGKTLRVQTIAATILDSAAVEAFGRVRLRANSASAPTTGSPIYAALDIGNFTGTAAAGAGNAEQLPIPGGLELAAGFQLGFSHVENVTGALVSLCAIGYEY